MWQPTAAKVNSGVCELFSHWPQQSEWRAKQSTHIKQRATWAAYYTTEFNRGGGKEGWREGGWAKWWSGEGKTQWHTGWGSYSLWPTENDCFSVSFDGNAFHVRKLKTGVTHIMHSIRKAFFFFLKQHQRQSHTIGKQDEVKIHTEQTSTGIIDEQSIITTIMVVYCLFKVIMYKRLWKWAKLRITFKVQIFSLSINPLNYLKCSSQIPRAHSGVFKLLVLSTQQSKTKILFIYHHS